MVSARVLTAGMRDSCTIKAWVLKEKRNERSIQLIALSYCPVVVPIVPVLIEEDIPLLPIVISLPVPAPTPPPPLEVCELRG
ncbi:MAG: hypothetical protein M3270_06715 [Thermoproteota archaeon]|nr:hypothetical protein [Thermoproteota archaeon]